VTSVDRRPLEYLLAASLLLGCGGGDKPTPAADTTPTDTAAAPEAAPAPATASKVGALPLLARLSPDHACSSQNFEGLTAIVKELTYRGDVPPRMVRVSLGAPERGFTIVNVESSIQQETSVGQSESERLTVIFTPTGEVQSGTREYTSTSDPSLNTRVGLLPSDTSAAKQLAQDVVDQCGRS